MSVLVSEGLYILGPRISAQIKHRDVLINSLFGQAKLATWLTMRNGLQGLGLVDPHLWAEFEHYTFVDDPDVFQKVWFIDGAVCSWRGTELVFCL